MPESNERQPNLNFVPVSHKNKVASGTEKEAKTPWEGRGDQSRINKNAPGRGLAGHSLIELQGRHVQSNPLLEAWPCKHRVRSNLQPTNWFTICSLLLILYIPLATLTEKDPARKRSRAYLNRVSLQGRALMYGS